LTAADTVQGGQTIDVSAAISVPTGAPRATAVGAELAVPAGWTAVASTPTTVASISGGDSATVGWRVTAPVGVTVGTSVLTATTRYTQGGKAGTLTDVRPVRVLPAPPVANTAVSALPFLSATNGWGPVERNLSNGEAAAGDGKPITVAGTVYASGVGVHAPSAVSLYLAGHCGRLTATVGLDDEVGADGSVAFSVLADGTAVYSSPLVTGASAGVPIDVDIRGASIVELIVSDGGNGTALDHADWADARVTCS
jgi:hypothetical protein